METSDILKQLLSLEQDIKANKPASRENMLVAAQALVTSLQTPSEFISTIGWAEPARSACIRTALDLKIFEALAQDQAKGGLSAGQIAEGTKADEALVARILRHLVAMNVLSEPSQDLYTNTKLSSQLTEAKYRDGLLYCYDVAGPSFRQLPAFLEKTAYRQPLNPVDGPFQFAHKTQNHFFPWLTENPTYLAAFANYMGGYRQGKQPWFAETFYPVRNRLVDGSAAKVSDPVFLVDVGGGQGHDLLALQSAFPDLPGRLVLQDKPEVIDALPPMDKIEAQAYDFFTPQPILGARAYFLHSVLHDWDDESCVKILQSVKSALKPGYSKVLVHDLIVPDKGASWGVTSMDWLMMVLGSVRERTEADFRRLFELAGLTIEKIWIYEQGTEGVIEAFLPA